MLCGWAGAAVAAEPETSAQCRPDTHWYQPHSGARVAFTDAIRQLASQRMVLLGEHHDNPDHHRWQLHTVAAIAGRVPSIAIGMEMFPRRVQPILDQWVRGELSEPQFLKSVDWDAIWSFDVQYYQPLFDFARLHRIPLIALNVDRALFNRVAHGGWDSVPSAEREGVDTPAPASKDYLRYLAGSFLRHNPEDAPGQERVTAAQGERFLRFVQGQLLWDRAMAQALAEVARKPGAPLVIGIVGSGHLAYRYGVPAQLVDLGVKESVVALPWDSHFQCDELTPALADFVFGVTK